MVILRRQLEIRQSDGYLRARDQEDAEHERQEPEEVVELVLPQRRHDEEQLGEDGTEGQDPADHAGEHRLDEPRLRGDLPWDLVRSDRERDRVPPVAEVRAQEDQWHRYAEPQHQQGEHRRERDRARRPLAPDEQVQDEEDGEHDARVQEGQQQRRRLPVITVEHLVQSGSGVAGQDAHEREQQHHRLEQRSPVRRRQEAEEGEDQRDRGHPQNLHAGPNGHGEQLRVPWFPEHVAVHQLPPGLLGRLLRGRKLVVLCDVSVQRAQQDHRHHGRQEEHDHQGVQNRKPMDLPACHLQVIVPSGNPTLGALGPNHIVSERDLLVLVELEQRDCRALVALGGRVARRLLQRLDHAVGLDLEAHNAVAFVIVRRSVVLQKQPYVVVDVKPSIPLDAHGEAIHVGEGGVLGRRPTPLRVARRARQVVDEPVHGVLVRNHALEFVLVSLRQRHCAQKLAVLVLPHLDLVGRILDDVAD
mmetsp:Transcript_30367/g.91946  ORF Transcript_30367/g.91946 Transcript_30367/m.91946 type:complete len:473 (+) Transcript_30367:321-1739(+)